MRACLFVLVVVSLLQAKIDSLGYHVYPEGFYSQDDMSSELDYRRERHNESYNYIIM